MLVRHTTSNTLLVGTVLVLAACGGATGDAAVDPEAAYRDAPMLMLAEERRFCMDEEAPGCQLETGTSVNVASNGGVFVWSISGPVTRFDSTGALAVQFGRSGGGPGEYRRVFGVHEEPDGRVVLNDFGRPGRLVFSADGTPLTTHNDTPDYGLRDLRPDPRGLMVLRDPPAQVGDSVQSEFRLFRDTLPSALIATVALVRVASSEGFRPMPAFFANTLRWAIESDSSAITASGPTLRVTRHYADGRHVDVVDVPEIGNRPVTPEQIAAERARRAPRANVTPQMRATLERAHADAEAGAPSIHQFAGELRALQDGAFMLKELEVRSDSARWTLFEHDGAVVGQIRLDARAEVVGGERSRLLLVTPDARDVPIVAWYRMNVAAP